PSPTSPPFPYTTLFRSRQVAYSHQIHLPPSHGGLTHMKKSELKDLTPVELNAKNRDLRQEMFNLRLQQASSQLEKPARLRDLRRDRKSTRLNSSHEWIS